MSFPHPVVLDDTNNPVITLAEGATGALIPLGVTLPADERRAESAGENILSDDPAPDADPAGGGQLAVFEPDLDNNGHGNGLI